MYDLILYDTSNFVDFPVGGQLTSIRNFLKYIVDKHSNFGHRLLLVGISTNQEEIGKICKVNIDDFEFDFLPVLYRNNNLVCVKKSLRLEYLKALVAKRKLIVSRKGTVHYIHTPEAFIEVKLMHPFAKTVIFSHGSFFNMIEGFRFYKNNKLVHWSFNIFLVFLLRKADLIFTLDDVSTKQYLRYTKKVVRVDNSIVLPKQKNKRSSCHNPIRLLFVGRLSKVKQIDEIIEATKILNGQAILTIVGDGEERNYLQKKIEYNDLENFVKLEGAVPPSKIGHYMRNNDILVMNSIFEGKPMTILEAMSYGLPIVTTPVGGISEMTIEHKNAEYTNGKANDISNAILKIVADYDMYENNSFASSEKYDYKLVNKKIFSEIYKAEYRLRI